MSVIPTRSRQTINWRHIGSSLILILLSVMIIAAGWMFGGGKAHELTTQSIVVETTVLPPSKQLAWQRRITGLAQASQDSLLSFETGGLIANLSSREGDRAQQGQIIAALASPILLAELAASEASLLAAQATLEELKAGPRNEVILAAEQDLKAAEAEAIIAHNDAKRLIASGKSASAQQRENAQQTAVAATARARKAQVRLDELRNGTRRERIAQQEAVVQLAQAQLMLMKERVAQTQLKAPYDGIITRRMVDRGTVIQPGQAVYRIQDIAPREVHLAIPRDLDHSAFQLGESLDLSTSVGLVSGTILGFVPEIDTATRSNLLRVQTDSVDLQPGEWIHTEVSQSTSKQGWKIPRIALREGDRGQWSCLVARPYEGGYRVEVRLVQIIHATTDQVFVTGSLAAGDELIIGGHQHLLPGMSVELQVTR